MYVSLRTEYIQYVLVQYIQGTGVPTRVQYIQVALDD